MAGRKTTFVRRVALLKGRLGRFKGFSWRLLIMLFSYIDLSLAVSAVILGSLTVNYCDSNSDTAKILAIINTVISAMIALFKGEYHSGSPPSSPVHAPSPTCRYWPPTIHSLSSARRTDQAVFRSRVGPP
jgi:hypothetical protein